MCVHVRLVCGRGGRVILVFSYSLSVIGRWVIDFIDLGDGQ